MAKGTTLNAEHLEALRHGRELANTVRTYLEALEENPRRRGRQRTVETIERQIAEATEVLAVGNVISRLKATQALRDLNAELVSINGRQDLGNIEAAFIAVAGEYSESNGISRETWLDAGVSKEVLNAAGIASAHGRRANVAEVGGYGEGDDAEDE